MRSAPDAEAPSAPTLWRHPGWRWFVAAVGWALLVALLAIEAAHSNQLPTSDQASIVLEGQALAHGSLLLHAWTLSLDSFWTTEVPFAAVGVLFVGVRPLDLYLVPAVIVACVVSLGVVLAAEGRRRAGALAGALAVATLLALPGHALARFLLVAGDHAGAMLWSLLAFYAVRRGRWGAGVVVAACALALGMVGDLLVLAYATVPMLLAGLVAMARTRSVRRGLPAMAAASGGMVLAVLVRLAANAAGAFSYGGANALASLHQVGRNIRHVYTFGSELIGLRTVVFGNGGVPEFWQETRVVGAVVLLACGALMLVRLLAGVIAGSSRDDAALSSSEVSSAPSRAHEHAPWWRSEGVGWHVDDMLLIGAFGSVVSFLALATSDNDAFARYLTTAVVFLAVLTGRAIGGAFDALSLTPRRAVLASLGACAIACAAVGSGYEATASVQSKPPVVLAQWLVAHHLSNGVLGIEHRDGGQQRCREGPSREGSRRHPPPLRSGVERRLVRRPRVLLRRLQPAHPD